MRTAAVARSSSASSARVSPNSVQQPVDVDPARVRVVVGELELVFLARQGQPFDQAQAAVDPRETAAVVFDAARDHFPRRAPRRSRGYQPEQRGIERGAERVDVVDEQRAELRLLGEEPGQRAVLQQVRHLEPVADGVQALAREVVGVVGCLAGGAAPSRSSAARTLSRTFCFCSSSRCCAISSHAKCRSRTWARAAGRSTGRARANTVRSKRIAGLGAEEALDRLVRQIAGREDVRHGGAELGRRLPATSPGALSTKMRCTPPSFANGWSALTTPAPCVQRLPDAGGVGDHGDLAAPQRGLAGPNQRRSQARLLELTAAAEDLRRRARPRSPSSRAAGSSRGRCGRRADRRESARAARGRIRSRRAAHRGAGPRVRPLRRRAAASRSSAGSDAANAGSRRAARVNCWRSVRSRGERSRGSRRSTPGSGVLVVLDRQQRVGAGEQRRHRAVLVDREIVDDGIHRERQRGVQLALRGQHDLGERGLPFGAARSGRTTNPMPPPDMPPSIQNPQKSSPNAARVRSMSRSV